VMASMVSDVSCCDWLGMFTGGELLRVAVFVNGATLIFEVCHLCCVLCDSLWALVAES
jgi:hypothetical protein